MVNAGVRLRVKQVDGTADYALLAETSVVLRDLTVEICAGRNLSSSLFR